MVQVFRHFRIINVLSRGYKVQIYRKTVFLPVYQIFPFSPFQFRLLGQEFRVFEKRLRLAERCVQDFFVRHTGQSRGNPQTPVLVVCHIINLNEFPYRQFIPISYHINAILILFSVFLWLGAFEYASASDITKSSW